jgi:hypothetical protein
VEGDKMLKNGIGATNIRKESRRIFHKDAGPRKRTLVLV